MSTRHFTPPPQPAPVFWQKSKCHILILHVTNLPLVASFKTPHPEARASCLRQGMEENRSHPKNGDANLLPTTRRTLVSVGNGIQAAALLHKPGLHY